MMSGNGAQLWFAIPPITLTNENRDVVQANLKDFEADIRAQVETKGIKVDSIHDLPRIIKVIGTVSRKGEPKAERPHRLSSPLDDVGRREDEALRRRLLTVPKPSVNQDQPKLPPQVDSEGVKDERELCFSYPETREWVTGWGCEILRNVRPLQGLLLHQPAFLPDACHCGVCTRNFEWETGKKIGEDDAAWLEWRAAAITDFVTVWTEDVKKESPPLLVGVVALTVPQGFVVGLVLGTIVFYGFRRFGRTADDPTEPTAPTRAPAERHH